MIKKTKLQKFHKHGLKAILYSLILSFVLSSVFGVLSLVSSRASAAELIEEAFGPAKTHEAIINLGNTKDSVGDEILKSSLIGGTNLSDYDPTVEENYRAPLIVRITKFLLRITVVLSITMVIYSGIMYIVEASKGAEVKETTNNLMYIIGGVLLALMSLGLVNLISSLSISSLNVTSTPGCLINGSVIASGDPLKQYVCENSFYGKWYGDRIGNRCRVDYFKNNPNGSFDAGHWAPITATEEESKCIELGGERRQ